MKNILYKMFEHRSLTREEATDVLLNIADGRYNDAQLSAFMTVFLMRSITTDELAGFRDALLSRRTPIDLGDDIKAIDIVGTGGDGHNTFNISTCTCFVVAGAGMKVVKHGNYGASSISGSSNVLEQHGVKFTSDPEKLRLSLERSGMVFLHAPLFSPALKSVGPVRKALGVRTFFNMLGPLVNPTLPKHQLLGVYNLKLMRLYGYIAQSEGIDCTIVHSLDGYDEISLTSPFKVSETRADGMQSEKLYTPEAIGFKQVDGRELFGGNTPADAAKIFDDILEGKASEDKTNCVVSNAAFAIRTLQPSLSLPEAISMANESIRSGAAKGAFKKFLELNT
ncbi:MAG: anthranilate phosphoribosyltransferase [Bacteroides sp.]|nr:anthranilate phosphoribosyltransferase [Bacteroides sp.]MDE7471139.1 anthranilate phosphoribosyltransferase [Paramuribaculum sp.]